MYYYIVYVLQEDVNSWMGSWYYDSVFRKWKIWYDLCTGALGLRYSHRPTG